MKNWVTIVLLLAFISFSVSCDKEEERAENDCSNLVCTLEFKVLTVTLKDSLQTPVVLDRFEVVDLGNGTEVTLSNSVFDSEASKSEGVYPIVSDGSIERFQSRSMEFIGFINSDEVIRSQYLAREGCCGVELISGDLQLVVN